MAVATPCLKFPHSPTTKPTSNDVVLVFRTNFLGTTSSKLHRTRSYEFHPMHRKFSSSSSSSSLPPIRRVCSASFDNSSPSSASSNYEEGEEFSKRMEELASKFQDGEEEDDVTSKSDEIKDDTTSLMEIQSIEMKAKSLDLPLSLRMIKRKKKQWKENLIEVVGEKNAYYCSVKKAFSSMVFIIRELHSYTLQMREILYYEDLKGILTRVQREMHASFVWLFQQVFSHTPTLMVYVMILLANFTVYSISDSAAIAAVAPPVATVEEREISANNFDATTMKTFTVPSPPPSSTGSKTTSIGGGNGGGNNVRPVGSGMDGDGWVNNTGGGVLHRPIVSSDGVASVREDTWQKEEEVWKEIVEEASRMKSKIRDEAIDDEILQGFVSPVSVEIDEGDKFYEDYLKTELNYQSELAQEPNNVLLLANYAQFLYLVLHDFDRAEEYFKRAIKIEPKDAEAHNKYANFLWQVRNDLWAAEETFLEAISADPSNSYYAANYAHFLWNTGGEDTCFPLDSPDGETPDA